MLVRKEVRDSSKIKGSFCYWSGVFKGMRRLVKNLKNNQQEEDEEVGKA